MSAPRVSDTGTSPDIGEVKADIEAHRHELAQAVDELSHKLDVRTRARPYVLPALGGISVLTVVLVLWRRRS